MYRKYLCSSFSVMIFIGLFASLLYAKDNRVEALYGKGARIIPGEIFVKFAPQIGNVESSPDVARIYYQYGIAEGERFFKHLKYRSTRKRSVTDLSRIYRLKVSPQEDVLDLCLALESEAAVLWAEPSLAFPVEAVPNDSLYEYQQHLPQIHAPEAWDVSKGSSDVIFATLDTGVDWDHPDLAANIWKNEDEVIDGIDNDHNGYIDDVRGWDFVQNIDNVADGEDGQEPDNDPMDFDGHGTFVSGCAIAVTDNEIGVAGVAWQGKIMPLRCGWEANDGQGYIGMGFLADALRYAADNGASVANISTGSSHIVIDAARYAFQNGVVITKSAGNANNEISDPLELESFTLSVAALDDRNFKATYSTYGDWVRVSAPGGDQSGGRPGILSTFFDDTYSRLQGTSFSAPITGGLALLLKGYNPAWSPADIVMRIVETADPIDAINPQYAGKLGSGAINAYRALTEEISPSPQIELIDVAVDDSLTGNNNKKLDIGETANIIVTLENTWADAQNVTLTMVVNDPEAQVINGTATLAQVYGISHIDLSTVSNESQPFTLSIDPNTVPHRIDATLQVEADGFSQTYDLGLSIDPRILVVDDDVPGRDGINVDVEDYYYDALDAIDVSFNTWDVAKVGEGPESKDLAPYDLVIWFCEKAKPSLDIHDFAAIKNYFTKYNGRVILFGQDIGWDMNDTAGDSNTYAISKGQSKDFYEKYLHARYLADNAFQSQAVGISGDPIGDGLAFSFQQPDRGPALQTPSRVDTLNGSVAFLTYPDGSPAGLRTEVNREAEKYKIVYFPFGGVEAILDGHTRQELLARSINWSNGIQVSHVPLNDIGLPSERQVLANITITSDTLQLDKVELLYTVNGVYPATVLPMTLVDSTLYAATIPAIDSGRVDYQILIKANNDFYAPRIHYSYNVGADTEAPHIAILQKPYNSLNKKGPFNVVSHIEDNTAVDTNQVYLHYWKSHLPPDSVKAQPSRLTHLYQAAINGDFMYGDTVFYYLSARDLAAQPNYAASEVDTFLIGYEDFEHGVWAWQANGDSVWDVSDEEPFHGAFSLADSPHGLPASDSTVTLTLKMPLDLSRTDYALLTFWSRNMLRVNKDFGYVELSADSGQTWQQVAKVKNLKPKWKQVVVPLGSFCGPGFDSVLFRFRLTTKPGDIADRFYGWHIDDILLREDVEVGVHATDHREMLPDHFNLAQNYPNPFNPTTTIVYQLPTASRVRIEIYNMLGQRIRTLVNGKQIAGYHQVIWNGEDDNGRQVASGMYFYRMRAGTFSAMRKLLLLK